MELVRLVAALSLARMRPILVVAGAPCLEEIDHIVAVGGMGEPSRDLEVATLKKERKRIGPLDDSAIPEYFQSTAAGIAVSVTSEASVVEDEGKRISSNIANFWDSCDDIMHAGNGYASPGLGIKTTLRGVEDMWQADDVRLLSASPRDSLGVFAVRLSEIRDKYPKRYQVAQVLADCAGWNA
ncbi:hypothetical protein [Streptomyces sp. DSM 41033]|uniref:hypothetical protein n=1 Tax=Streptomyces sp. DSM 41033 TaxID=3448655 RepID=UPI0040402EAB